MYNKVTRCRSSKHSKRSKTKEQLRRGKHETVFMGKQKWTSQIQLMELNGWRDAQTAHADRKNVPGKKNATKVKGKDKNEKKKRPLAKSENFRKK